MLRSPQAGFTPVAVLDDVSAVFHDAGITDPIDLDLWTALLTGLTDQQISNDPGGQRWSRLLDVSIDMFLDHVGALPEHKEPT